MPNPVYEDLLTRESSRRLSAIVKKLPEPVALCGGHAVRYRVRDEWKRQFNQEYFGSRDIDVAYQVRPEWTDDQLRKSALGQAPGVLENIGYKRSGSYRFEAILDAAGRPIETAPAFPSMIDADYFYLYIDTLATAPHPRAKQVLKFDPIVEPALAFAFNDPKQRDVLKELGPNVYLPSTPLLVATKLAGLPQRGDQGDKAIKDLCDLFALVQYGGAAIPYIGATVHRTLQGATALVDGATRHSQLGPAAGHLDIRIEDFRAAVGPLGIAPGKGKREGRQ